MPTIVANGKPRDVPEGSTIADLLEAVGWKPQWVVVECNGEAVERSAFADGRLGEGDTLEIVRAVAGGAAP
ncbi:MAG TPA: sulfur carrier protein ThiS [Actinomycetota bacterium]|nr:sulfur carrier protein ThiS [Actinomycetota bacterium]